MPSPNNMTFHSPTTVLVTGGAGFIGSNFIRHLLKSEPLSKVINVDSMTYAAYPKSLDDVQAQFGERYQFVHCDINEQDQMRALASSCDFVIHFAAESHVDRSLKGGSEFIDTNVRGTLRLLNACLGLPRLKSFIHISTDEVYGSLSERGYFTEETPISPSSLYSASKAASDLLVSSFVHTHQFPAIIARCSNNYGPYQFPEKFIPLMVTNALEERPLPIYGTGLNVRDWIYVDDFCEGIRLLLFKGHTGQIYNFGGRSEKRNLDVVHEILQQLNRPASLIRFVEDRKGHDHRYAMNCFKSENELGWKQQTTFPEGLKKTIQWYVQNPNWWQPIKSGAYLQYYKDQYGDLK